MSTSSRTFALLFAALVLILGPSRVASAQTKPPQTAFQKAEAAKLQFPQAPNAGTRIGRVQFGFGLRAKEQADGSKVKFLGVMVQPKKPSTDFSVTPPKNKLSATRTNAGTGGIGLARTKVTNADGSATKATTVGGGKLGWYERANHFDADGKNLRTPVTRSVKKQELLIEMKTKNPAKGIDENRAHFFTHGEYVWLGNPGGAGGFIPNGSDTVEHSSSVVFTPGGHTSYNPAGKVTERWKVSGKPFNDGQRIIPLAPIAPPK